MFEVGYHNAWRLHEVRGCLDRLDIGRIIADPRYREAQSIYRLVAMFLWDHGRFQKFAKIMGRADQSPWANALEAAFERPMPEIASLWRNYLTKLRLDFHALATAPTSQVYPSEAAFRDGTAVRAGLQAWIARLLDAVSLKRRTKPCPFEL